MNYTTVLCHKIFASVYISSALSLELQIDFIIKHSGIIPTINYVGLKSQPL